MFNLKNTSNYNKIKFHQLIIEFNPILNIDIQYFVGNEINGKFSSFGVDKIHIDNKEEIIGTRINNDGEEETYIESEAETNATEFLNIINNSNDIETVIENKLRDKNIIV